MIQRSTIAVALATAVLGVLPAAAADFRAPNESGPYYSEYGAPPQEVYPPPARYGYVPAPPVYAPPAVVVAPEPSYAPHYEPYYVRPRTVYVYPRYDRRVRRPYAERRYSHYREWDRGYRRW